MAELGKWTFSADGNGTAVSLDTITRPFELIAYGTWGSGTLTAQFSPDGGTTYIAVTGVSLMANGYAVLGATKGDKFRPVLTGSTNPSLTILARETITT